MANDSGAAKARDEAAEGGITPDQIIATYSTAGKVDRLWLFCRYPEVSVFNGSGSIDDAWNFTCKVRGLGLAENWDHRSRSEDDSRIEQEMFL